MNKSIIIFFAFVLSTTFSHAQTSSGNMMLGGGFQYSSTSNEGNVNNNSSSFGFSPSFGYFIGDNLAIGTSLNLGTSRNGTGDAKTVTGTVGFGPFVRYYMPTSNESFSFFGQAGLSIASSTENPPVGDNTKTSSLSFLLSPGAAYFFNEHWALEFSITAFRISRFDPNTANDDNARTTVDFGLTTLSPSLGFRYHF